MAFTDDFTDTDATDLSDHTPSGGTAWTLGGASNGSRIDSNGCSAKSTDGFTYCDDQGSADHRTEIKIVEFSSYYDRQMAASRLVDISNYITGRMAGTGSAGRRLSIRTGGTYDDVYTDQGALNDVLETECDGTTIKFYANGVLKHTENGVTDHQTETSQGIVSDNSHSAAIPTLDDFLAEALAAGGSAALTGTVTASITESDIVTGGKTIILTLTGDTWVAAGTGPIGSTADTQAIIDGIDSAQAEANGWDAVVKVGIDIADVVRTSSTVCTITLDAEAAYDITAQETITATIPAVALVTSSSPIVASPTFTIDIVAAGVTIPPFVFMGNRMI